MNFFNSRAIETNSKSASDITKTFDEELVKISTEYLPEELRVIHGRLKTLIEEFENKELNDIILIIENQK